MKSIIIASVLLGCAAWAADEASDRTAIENAVRLLNVTPAPAGLFTADFDRSELAALGTTVPAGIPITVEGAPGTVVISKEPMGEAQWFPAGVRVPLVAKRIRFLTPEVAMVDAAGKTPVLIMMKKVGTDWKIASVRILAEK